MSRFPLKVRAFSVAAAVFAGVLGASHGARASEDDGTTDHQQVIRKWGVEAQHIGSFATSSHSPNPRCGNVSCTVDLNSIGVRRWLHERYAFNAALALAVGGGSTNVQNEGTWDTHIGLGPIVGANFLLGQAKHLTVSAVPQLTFVAFMPSGTGTKTFVLDVRGSVEAEIHLGFIGLPQMSVGTSLGLAINWTKKTAGGADADHTGGAITSGPNAEKPFTAWGLNAAGATNILGIVNHSFVRFYF